MNVELRKPSTIDAALLARAEARLPDLHRLQAAGLIHREGEFYPSVHYPPITMYPDMGGDEFLATWTPQAGGQLDVYVHIPFCARKCTFCHYPVKAGKHLPEKDRYLDALRTEMDIWLAHRGLDKIPVRSILIGGGTPTYMEPEQLDRFFTFFTERLDLSGMTQFNVDVDPSTVLGEDGLERMKIMRKHGVDRVTFGLQSMDDTTLRRMNRPHNSAEGRYAVDLAKSMGFITNIEFIFGYYGQTVESWLSMMKEAIALDADEIQLYRLKVEPYGDGEGRVTRLKVERPDDFPSGDDAIRMKAGARALLNDAGYFENLSRVYSKKPEIYSHYAHNQCCDLEEQVGFGQTAFSSLRDRFSINTEDLNEYYERIESMQLPITRGLHRTREQQLRWTFILPLKARTIVKSRFLMQTGVPLEQMFVAKVARLKEHGLLWESDTELGLTEVGRFFAEEVAHQFHHPDHIPYPATEYADGPLHPYRDQDPLAD